MPRTEMVRGAEGTDELEAAAAMEAARAERERLEALLEFAPAFIVAFDEHGTIDFINRTLPQYDKKDVIGSHWLQYFPPAEQEVMRQSLATMYATEATQTYETTTPGPNGEQLCFDSQIAPVRVGGKITGAVLVAQDVTQRKREQAELLAGRHMALLGTLAAGVAHEINTPIQFVGDSVQFLRDASRELLALIEKIQAIRHSVPAGKSIEAAIEEAAKVEAEADLPYLRENMPLAFDRCLEGLGRVTTIVRSLKEFAHPAAKEMVAADLNRAVQSTLVVATNEYKYVAELRIELGDLPPVTCHVSEISQAILNIVVNAAHAIADVVKGSGRKGVITVRTWREGDAAVIAIGDSGGGIPDAIRSRIFDPFFTTKEVGKGTGQGLAIALSTVRDHHGGELTFDSRAGEGTTFFIRIPVAGTPAPLEASKR